MPIVGPSCTALDTKAKVAPNKLAMSRALGAAFLNHQVEQLEKSVSNAGSGGNWRERRNPDAWRNDPKRANVNIKIAKKRDMQGPERDSSDEKAMRSEREHGREDWHGPKDADVIVVDASVLVHALPRVKKWCRDGREEVVIVPLEALNTLDLLKKGTSPLAQRARAASRILEAQVGTNPRIRVQQDDAFVLWDSIPFRDQPPNSQTASPEWVRRIICCARWETEHATDGDVKLQRKPRIVLAILSQAPELDVPAVAPVSASPVPLPAPQPNRYESRLLGSLVATWAAKAGIEVLEVAPPPPPATITDAPPKGRRSPEEERTKRGQAHTRGRRNSYNRNGERSAAAPGARPGSASSGLVERPPAVMAMMEMVAQPSRVVPCGEYTRDYQTAH
ncbi:hypothetical protein A0H81_07215 [Grifola frondosa]|uniref:PIN domain-containing protein n=1 Tax=Grifola frondosa TaxID=5627 RepID=A0A1C7MAI3_GRIFR|nr:hypothetical protein A0H81_07215 [Grifola frondosa]